MSPKLILFCMCMVGLIFGLAFAMVVTSIMKGTTDHMLKPRHLKRTVGLTAVGASPFWGLVIGYLISLT